MGDAMMPYGYSGDAWGVSIGHRPRREGAWVVSDWVLTVKHPLPGGKQSVGIVGAIPLGSSPEGCTDETQRDLLRCLDDVRAARLGMVDEHGDLLGCGCGCGWVRAGRRLDCNFGRFWRRRRRVIIPKPLRLA